jgi:hypothetical protein
MSSETLLTGLESDLHVTFLCLFNSPDQGAIFPFSTPQPTLGLFVFTLCRQAFVLVRKYALSLKRF